MLPNLQREAINDIAIRRDLYGRFVTENGRALHNIHALLKEALPCSPTRSESSSMQVEHLRLPS